MRSSGIVCLLLVVLPSPISCGGGDQASGSIPANSTTSRISRTAATPGTPSQKTVANCASSGSSVACYTYGEELYVANYDSNSIAVYSRTATASVAPLRTISGSSTALSRPIGIAVDAVNNEIYSTDLWGGSVVVHSRSASGNVAPLRTITGLPGPYGISVDAVNNEIYVQNLSDKSIGVYSRTASGSATPLRSISGASTGLTNLSAIAVDTVNNEIFATNLGDPPVAVFSLTASGNVPPLRTISGSSTGLLSSCGIAVDTVNNEIFVINYQDGSITVYPRTVSGNVAPSRTIVTLIQTQYGTYRTKPTAITVDAVNNEISVSSYELNGIAVYSRTASGQAAPLRGIATGLNGPHEMAIPESSGGYCAAQYACASIGCMPPGSVDCGNGYYCSVATTTICSQTQPTTCMPLGSVDCQNGYYCASDTACAEATDGGASCSIVVDAGVDAGERTLCSDESYCPPGYVCAAVGCMPPGSHDCGNGYYCSAGTTCAPAMNGATVCNPIGKCTYAYSDWSACGSNNTKTRTVLSSSPEGCSGTPVLSEKCSSGGGNCGSFTKQQCCAGSPGIAAVSCAVDNTYIQACGCPTGTTKGGSSGPNNTWCICP